MGTLKELKLSVGVFENFTPNSLMLRYAALHPGVVFEHRPYFETGLKIENNEYRYDHWKIEPGEDGQEVVTLYMRKAEKELYRWSMDCFWPAVGYSENVSVLAESEADARQMAQEAFQNSCGALPDETKIVNIVREKADLGLELYKAARDYYGGYDKVAGLIQRGADVNYRFAPDKLSYTPLHMAAYNAALLKIELLVEAGCDLNPLAVDGTTPLDFAIARFNNPTVVEYLVEHGALRGLDVVLQNARERSRETVEHSKNNDLEIVY